MREHDEYASKHTLNEEELIWYGREFLTGVATYALRHDEFTLNALMRDLHWHSSQRGQTERVLTHILPYIADGLTRQGFVAGWDVHDGRHSIIIDDMTRGALARKPPTPERSADVVRLRVNASEYALKRLMWHTARDGCPARELLGWMREPNFGASSSLTVLADMERLQFITVLGDKDMTVCLADPADAELDNQIKALRTVRECLAIVS